MPSDALVAAGENATLLIHEASMADDESQLAKRNGHSTLGQAVDVGKRYAASAFSPALLSLLPWE